MPVYRCTLCSNLTYCYSQHFFSLSALGFEEVVKSYALTINLPYIIDCYKIHVALRDMWYMNTLIQLLYTKDA